MDNAKLGFGLMRLPLLDPNNAGSIDVEATCKLVDKFIESGFTYFDTALMYCGAKSEACTKKFLVDRYPREKYTLATKLHADFIHTKEDRDRVFSEQLARTGVKYFDYYLLHEIGGSYYDKFKELDCFEWIQEKKRQGLVKTIGFSFHDTADVLEDILKNYPFFEFVQLQINYVDWESEGIQARRCYETACKYGKPVIVMEPVKGGTLVNLPEEAEALLKAHNPSASTASWAIRFAASLENVRVVLSGMNTMEQMEDNIHTMKSTPPLSEEEYRVIDEAVNIINANIAVACTGCAYCTAGCPMHIAIPQYFSLYNMDLQELKGKPWTSQRGYYANLAKSFGRPGDCIACGQCEAVCPQHLPIIESLKKVAEHFE